MTQWPEMTRSHNKKKFYHSQMRKRTTHLLKRLEMLISNWHILPVVCRVLTPLIGEKKIVVAAIGQAIKQNARLRAVLAPLQVALGAQVHYVTASKFMVQQLNNLGFAVSYSDVQLFERSAAVNKETDLPQEFDNATHSLHLHADNVDDTIATLDGYGQLHSMGMMASVSPGIRTIRRRKIPKVSHDDLSVVGTVLIRFTNWNGTNPGMKYRKTDLPAPDNKQTLFY